MTTVMEDIIEILTAIYQIPGEYFIAGIISGGIGSSMLNFTNWGYVLIVFGVICLIIEIVLPFLAGVRLYEKAVNNLINLFKKR